MSERARVVLDDDGKPVRVQGTDRDVAERRESEEQARALLREQAARGAAETAAERFRLLADAGQLLAAPTEVAEMLRRLARLLVPRMADWCGVDVAEAGGRLRRLDIVHADPARTEQALSGPLVEPADPERADAYAVAVRRGEPVLVPEISDALLDELARDEARAAQLRALGLCSALVVPLRARGRVLGVLTLATAESGRRFTHEDLAIARSLGDRAGLALDAARLLAESRAAARAREEAVQTVSHDLRNPLNLVSLCLPLLREAPTEEARKQAISRIERAVAGMQRMIRDLLDVTRVEGGRLEIRPSAVPVEPLLAEACGLVEASAAARSVRIECEVEPGLCVFADRDRVLQVLSNLLENAVRHTREGGAVRAGARAVGERVHVAVADEGPGIPAEVRERVFERFWQGPSNLHDGAGVGLAIARGLVELHGGEIWTESAEPSGARFCFTLQRANGEAS